MEKKKQRNGKVLNCETCNKEFYVSPARLKKNKHHNCSRECLGKFNSKKYSRKVKRQCVICNKTIEYKPSHSAKIKNPTCSRVCSAKRNSIMYKGEGNPKSLKLSPFERIFWDRVQTYRSRSSFKGMDADIDYKFLIDLYNKQEGKCYYTNIEMQITGKKTIKTMSLDRIDSSKGYMRDNVVFCLNCINMMKSDSDLEEIREIFKSMELKHAFEIRANVQKLYVDAKLPKQSNRRDAGHDIYVHRVEDCGSFIKVYSGIAVQPEDGYYFMLVPRSSTYKKGLSLSNNLGIIDMDYTGEIMSIFNKTDLYIDLPKIGDRLTQLIPQKQIYVEFEEVEDLDETERGSGAFGSTGE